MYIGGTTVLQAVKTEVHRWIDKIMIWGRLVQLRVETRSVNMSLMLY